MCATYDATAVRRGREGRRAERAAQEVGDALHRAHEAAAAHLGGASLHRLLEAHPRELHRQRARSRFPLRLPLPLPWRLLSEAAPMPLPWTLFRLALPSDFPLDVLALVVAEARADGDDDLRGHGRSRKVSGRKVSGRKVSRRSMKGQWKVSGTSWEVMEG